jgi:hypothetical protein
MHAMRKHDILCAGFFHDCFFLCSFLHGHSISLAHTVICLLLFCCLLSVLPLCGLVCFLLYAWCELLYTLVTAYASRQVVCCEVCWLSLLLLLLPLPLLVLQCAAAAGVVVTCCRSRSTFALPNWGVCVASHWLLLTCAAAAAAAGVAATCCRSWSTLMPPSLLLTWRGRRWWTG